MADFWLFGFIPFRVPGFACDSGVTEGEIKPVEAEIHLLVKGSTADDHDFCYRQAVIDVKDLVVDMLVISVIFIRYT